MRTSSLFLVSVVVGVGGLGCGSNEPPTLDEYFAAKPYANAACNAVDDRLAGERHMRLYVNGAAAIEPITQGLASYYARHSLTFSTDVQPQKTSMTYALDTNMDDLIAAAKKQFPDVDFTDYAMYSDPAFNQEFTVFAANFLLRPMIEFANAHVGDGADITHLVLVPDMERPGGESITEPGSSLAGLSVSPALLAQFASTGATDGQTWQSVDLPAGFAPMMVLGSKVLARAAAADPVYDDLIVAHEFGHSGGLVHSSVERNLMYPDTLPGDDCTNGLDDAQLAIMSASYGLGPATAGPLASRTGALTPAGSAKSTAAFPREQLRALMSGDRAALRSFVGWLFHPPTQR
jgi:hypothetical protein